MNKNIYNENVANFQKRIKQHQNDVINGIKKPHNLEEFKALTRELEELSHDYNVIAKSLGNDKDKQELDKFLKAELNYLEIYSKNIVILGNYYNYTTDINVEADWNDLKTLVYESSLHYGLEQTEHLLQVHKDDSQIIERVSKTQNTFKEALGNIDSMARNAYAEMLKKSDFISEIKRNNKILDIQKAIKSHKESVIIGKIFPKTLEEFAKIYNDVEDTSNLFTELNMRDEFKEEKEYLDTLLSFMRILKSTQNEQTILNGWETIQTVFKVKSLSAGLDKANELLAQHPENESIKERVIALESTLTNIIKVNSQEEILLSAVCDDSVNLSNNIADTVISSQIKIDEEYLENCSEVRGIEYLNNIIANIIKMPGDKKYLTLNGATVTVPESFISLYMKCIALKSELLNKKKENERLIFEKFDLVNDFAYKYYETESQFKSIEEKLDSLIFKAKLSNEKKSMVPDFFCGDNSIKVEIQESDLADYNNLYNEYIKLMSKFEENIDYSRKEQIFENMSVLAQADISDERLAEEIKKLKKDLCELEIPKKAKTISSFRRMLKKQGFTKEDAEYLAAIAYEPEKLIKNKNTSDEKKRNILEKFLEIMYLEEENYDEQNETQENNKSSIKETLSNFKKKFSELKIVKRCLEYKENKVEKIKGVKKSKNKPKLREDISNRFKQATMLLAFGAVLSASAYSTGNYQVDIKSDAIEANNVPNENTETIIDTETNDSNNNYLDEYLPKLPSEMKEDSTESKLPINPLLGGIPSETKESENQFDSLLDNIKNITPGQATETQSSMISSQPKFDDISVITKGMIDSINTSLQTNNNENDKSNSIYTDGKMSNITQKDHVKNTQDDNEWDNSTYYSMGDTITVDDSAQIYTNMYDGAAKINGESTYFATSSPREIIGIAYMETNGNVILLRADEPDLKEKMTALENNGAVRVAVKCMNLEVGYGVEGYYNIEDIEKEQERGR